MKIEWVGHSCFRLTLADGTVIATDPYDESVGIRMIPVRADLVTMSHQHHDHANRTLLQGNPVILTGTEEWSLNGLHTKAFSSFHDDVRGAKRGTNCIRVFEADGVKVVHMGDQGCMPSKEIMNEISGADIMLIPAGGFYTIDAEEAKELSEKANARMVIPMHVKTQNGRYPIAPVGDFLKVMGAEKLQPVPALEVIPGGVQRGVVLLRPEADAL